MRIIAVMLGLASIVIALNAFRYSATPVSERHLAEAIQRWRNVPNEESRVVELARELERQRAARDLLTNVSFGCCGLFIFFAMGAWQYAALRKQTQSIVEPRFFTPIKHRVLAAGRRFSARFFSREERVAQARTTLHPTLERLFGSKKG